MPDGKEEMAAKVISSIVEDLGYDLVELAITRHKVEVYIDNQTGGITVDECTVASRQIAEGLDRENVFDGSYILEVSSPGSRRRLETSQDFKRVMNKKVSVSTREPVQAGRAFTGVVTRVEPEAVTLECGTDQVVVPYRSIVQAKVKYET